MKLGDMQPSLLKCTHLSWKPTVLQDFSLGTSTHKCLMMMICSKEAVPLPLQPACMWSRRILKRLRRWRGKRAQKKSRKTTNLRADAAAARRNHHSINNKTPLVSWAFLWFSSFLSCSSSHPLLLLFIMYCKQDREGGVPEMLSFGS